MIRVEKSRLQFLCEAFGAFVLLVIPKCILRTMFSKSSRTLVSVTIQKKCKAYMW